MKAQPISALILGAAVCVVSAVGLVNSFGADVAGAPKGGQSRQGAAEPKGVSDSALDNVLEIDGGAIVPPGSTHDKHGGKAATLKNVVEALRERYTEANIVIAPGLENVKIADLKLRTRNLWEDLEAIRVASGAEFEWQGPGSPVFSEQGPITPSAFLLNAGTQVNPATGLAERPGDPGSTGLFVLRPASVLPDRERSLEAFNIEPYIGWLIAKEINPADSKADPRELAQKNRLIATDRGIQEVEQIIGESLAAMSQSPSGSKEPPQFKFHSGANILIVVGTQYQLDVARKVISALPSVSGIAGQSGRVSEPRTSMSPDQADAFRRRYGLPPAGPTPGDVAPGRPPQQQAQPK